MLELYYFHGATCGLKARFTMAEKEADYTPRVLTREELTTPEYLKLNPNAVVPTLVHDGTVLVESSIIMRYVDDVVDGPPLRPAAPLDHARMGMWMKRADEYYLPALGTFTYTIAHRDRLLAEHGDDLEGYLAAIPDPARRERRRKILLDGFDSPDFAAALRTLDGMLAVMEKELGETAFLAGNAYSLADAAITPFVERLDELQCAHLWEEGRPALADWWDRIRARDSYDAVLGRNPHPGAAHLAETGAKAQDRLRAMLRDA